MDEPEDVDPFEEPELNRDELIDRAADAIDSLGMHLGPGERPEPSREGDFAREFKFDEAEPTRPLIQAIAAESLDRNRDDVPVETSELFRGARFYWITLPVKLYTRVGWAFNRLQAKATFDSGDSGDSGGPGPTAFFILPDPQFVTYFEGKQTLRLGINGRLKARAGLPQITVGQPGGPEIDFDAGGAVEAEASVEYVLGPNEYRLTAAKVKHWGHGQPVARWRLDGARYLDEADPGLRVMLRVPDGTTALRVRVAIEARRYFSAMEATFQEKVKAIPEIFATFFRNGAPIGGTGSWDLTADL